MTDNVIIWLTLSNCLPNQKYQESTLPIVWVVDLLVVIIELMLLVCL
jgi:hypothetical protein